MAAEIKILQGEIHSKTAPKPDYEIERILIGFLEAKTEEEKIKTNKTETPLSRSA